MRTIKFKAKKRSDDKWIEGHYTYLCEPIHKKETHLIIDETYVNYEVYPKSLCQFTGLSDQNGTPIYENDVIHVNGENGEFIVVFYEGCFSIATDKQFERLRLGLHPFFNDYAKLPILSDYTGIRGTCEVIGNVFETK